MTICVWPKTAPCCTKKKKLLAIRRTRSPDSAKRGSQDSEMAGSKKGHQRETQTSNMMGLRLVVSSVQQWQNGLLTDKVTRYKELHSAGSFDIGSRRSHICRYVPEPSFDGLCMTTQFGMKAVSSLRLLALLGSVSYEEIWVVSGWDTNRQAVNRVNGHASVMPREPEQSIL